MKRDVFLKLSDVSLDYFHYTNRKGLRQTILKSFLKFIRPIEEKPFSIHRALNGIDLLINTGDRVGIIGKNGSGKSTLLRVLSGIYQPTSGELEVYGTVSSLLDISVGLNPDITGYENIVLMGILRGKTKREMKQKFEDIEEFTELNDFLRLPIRTYSNGMRLRLAFGIATCIETDILILDEVIGVGDQNFMEKAKKRLKNLIHKSQILVLTSHSASILEALCNKAMVLDKGKCLFYGDLQQGIQMYNQTIS